MVGRLYAGRFVQQISGQRKSVDVMLLLSYFHLGEKPKIHELQLLHGEDRETVRVIDKAAAKWEELAYGLHFESHDVANIKKNNPSDVTAACREVLIQWEAGKGRKPVEWRTLLQALEDAQLDEVAPKLRSVLCSKKTK